MACLSAFNVGVGDAILTAFVFWVAEGEAGPPSPDPVFSSWGRRAGLKWTKRFVLHLSIRPVYIMAVYRLGLPATTAESRMSDASGGVSSDLT